MNPRSFSILLVEDNADTLTYLARMLALRGHRVRTAADMRTAFRAAADAEFDLLISDIELPDGTGLQLMRALRLDRAIPGIALSGFGSADDIEMSYSAGFAAHLIKPVEFRALEEVIHRLASRSPIERMVQS